MDTNFYRVQRLPPYVFSEINNLKAKLRGEGRDIIDFGMGNPDMSTPPHIVSKLIETVSKSHTHGYSASKGIHGLRKAQAGYYKRRWGVKLDPETEIIATLGSKEGLANLAMAITAPGDAVVVPNPAYPIHPYGFMIAGGSIRHVKAVNSQGNFDPEEYLSNLDRAVRHSVPKPIAMIVNFPSNPTAHVCDLAFYSEIIKFAKKHQIWVLSDLAYSEIYFNDKPTPSLLQIEGARDVAIEFTSMSKTFAMAGWRMGFAVGNHHLVAALAKIKSYLDYGAFTPVQVAAAAALNGPEAPVKEIRDTYRARRDVLIDSMGRAGWQITPPDASMFAWAKIPKEFENLGSMGFAKCLLMEAGVAVAPGLGFGEYGEGFVRVGLVENEQRIRQAARNIKKLFKNASELKQKYEEKDFANE